MIKSLPLFLLGLTAMGVQAMTAQNVTSANITDQSAETKAGAVYVALNGSLTSTNNGDFRQLRDLCFQMKTLDLHSAICADIPKNALHSHHNLQTLRLPSGVKTIGSQAFFACDGLNGTIHIPQGTKSIGASAFAMCKNIKELSIVKDGSLDHIGSYAFKGCESLGGTVVLPDSMTVLRDGVFEGCVKLEGVSLPDNLQSIGTNTFYKCI